MEDAYVFSQLIASSGDIAHIAKSCRAYDAVRMPRTRKRIDEGRNAALIMDFLELHIVDDIYELETALKSSYKWLCQEDL